MFRKSMITVVAVLMLASLSFTVAAQDNTVVGGTVTLEEVTANSADYYGQTVTLEGILIEFVNVNSFVLGEDALLDDDRVLVINNSGSSIPRDFFRGDRVVITGVVHPSLEARTAEMGTVEPAAEMTPETEMGTSDSDTMNVAFEDSFNFYYESGFPDDFDNFTIIEITAMEEMQRVAE
jgi:hypothetical protein